MKPDWNLAPEWAKYLAMDADGAWYWYSSKPRIDLSGLWENYGLRSKRAMALPPKLLLEEAKNSLEARP